VVCSCVLREKRVCPSIVQGLDLKEEICFLRERDSEIGFSELSCVFSVGSCVVVVVLLVWRIVSLVRHTSPNS
jgi:hypothetical protein